jgi:hypothetical protein
LLNNKTQKKKKLEFHKTKKYIKLNFPKC